MITDIEETEARQLAKTHRCAEPGCKGLLSVAWGGNWGINHYILRCGKDPGHKAIRPDIDMEGVNMTNRTSQDLVRYETPMGAVEISVEAIRQYLCPKATAAEAFIFLQRCRYQRLNPFMGEAYLVVYEQTERSPRTAALMVGKQAHTRRAERNPDYEGMEAGLIVTHDGAVEQVAGAFMSPGDELLGGWCKVYRKGKQPFFISLSLKEYTKGTRFWQQMPATMIRKCAITQALTEAFPGDMAGLQASEEFALAEDNPVVVEGELVQAPSKCPVSPAEPRGGPGADRDREPDMEDLFPGTPDYGTENLADVFDPEQASPPALPPHVTAMTHFEAVLKEHGWDVTRLQSEVLGVPLATYLRTHKVDDAYQAFRRAVGK